MNANKLREAEHSPGLHTFFKLQTTIAITSMVLFDHAGVLKKYDSVESIMKEFFELRLKYYAKRKKFMEGALTAEASRLSNQARFILEKCDGTVKVENKKKKNLIAELQRRGYDSDPVKAWTKSQQSATDLEESEAESENEDQAEESNAGGPDYDYLVGMPMWNLTEEKKNQILKQRDEKQVELRTSRPRARSACGRSTWTPSWRSWTRWRRSRGRTMPGSRRGRRRTRARGRQARGEG